MWLFSKKNKVKQKREGIPFLRKPLPKKHERHIGAEEKKKDAGSQYIIFFLWTLFFLTIGYLFLFSSFTCLETIEVSGTENIKSERIVKSIHGALSGKYMRIFPQCALGLIRMQSLVEKLQEAYPLIEHISMERIFPNRMHIDITERQYILLWNTEGNQYLVDEAGVTHDATSALLEENQPFLITLSDVSGKSFSVGEKVLNPEYIQFLFALVRTFPSMTEITLLSHFTIVSPFADELRGLSSEGWEVYFNTSIPLEKSLSTLTLLLETKLPPSKRQNIGYIDLRTENRVYYTFRDGTDGEISSLPVDTSKSNDTQDVKKKKEK